MNLGGLMNDEYIKNQLINSPLEERRRLTIPVNARFGLEIELENVCLDKIYQLVRHQFGSNWKVKEDRSLQKGYNAEISTPPLENSNAYWNMLKKLSDLLVKLKPTFNSCSLQINLDGMLLPTLEDRINFLKLYAYYEDVIYRFSKGSDEKYRDSISIYSSPIILLLKDALQNIKINKIIVDEFSNRKDIGVTFKTKDKDIIEFRTPNGTCEYIYWQNYLTFFYYFIKMVKTQKYNIREIDDYINSFSNIQILKHYEELNEDKGIGLSKKMFRNQQDRVYFLQQYIGKNK